MKNWSVLNTFQKIHTYAQDLKAVRASKNIVSANSPETVPIPPTIPQSNSNSKPTVKQKNTTLLVPVPTKVPLVRTMVSDTQKITTHKDEMSLPNNETVTKIEKTNSTQLEQKKYKPSPKSKKIEVEKIPPKKYTVLTKKQLPEVPPNKTFSPTTNSQKITTPNNIRDKTYTATMIRDTKYKRFNLWRELGKKFRELFNTKTNTIKNRYTAPFIPIEKGVVQNNALETKHTSLAEYSALKERVRNRPLTETPDTAEQNADELTNATALAKTRAKLLSTIEEEVSTQHKLLPSFKPNKKSQSKNPPVIFVKDKLPAQQISQLPKEPEVITRWEHYLDDSPRDLPAKKVVDQPIPNIKATPKLTLVADPLPTDNMRSDLPTSNPVAHKLILPIIPTATAELAPLDNSTTTEELASELKNYESNLIDTRATNQPLELDQPETTQYIQPEPIFTQPKIIPTLPKVMAKAENLPTSLVIPAKETPISPFINQPALLNNNPLEPHRRQRIINFITQYTHTFVLGGLILGTFIIIGSIGVNAYLSSAGPELIKTASQHYFNNSTIHPLTLSPVNRLNIKEQITNYNNALGVSEIILQNKDNVIIPPTLLISLLELPIDPVFANSLLDIRFGWYRDAPFMILHYTDDAVARGSMLQWERTLYTNFMSLFSLNIPTMAPIFKDEIINKIDVRRQYTTDHNPEILYGVIAANYILITTSEMAFLNLTNNFNHQ